MGQSGRASGSAPLATPAAQASPAPIEETLSCTIAGDVEGVNFRNGPSVEFAPPLRTLLPGTPVTATGRNGDVPWLRVRLEDGSEGWLSSRGRDGSALVRCEGDEGTLPEVGPDLAAAEEVAEEEAEPEPIEPTITLAPTLRLREGNGPNLNATRRTFAIAVDGDLSEWGNTSAATIGNVVFQPENWLGAQDLSGTVRAAWDDGFLYLAAQVTDDQVVQTRQEDLLYQGDALEFYWDSDLQGDFESATYNEDDVQAIMSPGNFAGSDPSAWVYRAQAGNFFQQIEVAARRTPSGYDIEVRLPWGPLGVQPRAGNVYGYAIALSDDDTPGSSDQETMLATAPARPYNNPTAWGNFVLEP